MDRPGPSRRVSVRDRDFNERISAFLDDNQVSNDDSDESEYVDDSDADPDYVLVENESDSEDEYMTDYDNDSEDLDDDNLLEGESANHNVDLDLPEYLSARLRKGEFGPAYPWHTKEPDRNVRVRTPGRNIIAGGLPGLTLQARRLGNNPDNISIWKTLFDEQIVEQVVINTNVKLGTVRNSLSLSTNKSNYKDTDTIEINALIGLLLLSSVLKSNHETVKSMFTKDSTNRPIFNATMSVKRFEILLSALRFDDSTTRHLRKTSDKAAAISEIFHKVISNSQKMYCLSEHVTIDEMLIPFRGRCGFRMFLPNKPHKYGVKVMCLTDAKTSYLFNAYIYTGKGSDGIGLSAEEKNKSKPTQSVLRLTQPIQNTNRNVTADNWFSSIDVTEDLEKNGLTYVGTLKKDKKVIPQEFLPDPSRRAQSARYAFNGTRTIVSYVPKKNRSVVLISTMHNSIVTNQQKKKPEIICFYNKTKCGVDILDMKCAIYSSGRRTRRWPLAVFYRLLSVASINSFILYLCYTETKMTTRFDFTKTLGLKLVEPHLRRRLSIPNLPRDIRYSIKLALGDDSRHRPALEGAPSDKMEKRKTCGKCPSVKERKTQYKCIRCDIPICLECSRKVCNECAIDCA